MPRAVPIPQAAPTAAAAPAQAAPSGLAPPITIKGDQFVGPDGKPIYLHGLNWFGFNDAGQTLGGLWENAPLADFATTVWRQKLLGFNAVRLPFSFAVFNQEPKKVVHSCPDVSDADVVRSTLADDEQGVDIAKAPKLPNPPKRQPGQCNGYVQGNTIREQFIWTVNFLVDQGFYVLVDNHYREDPTVEKDQRGWEQGWSDLAHALLSDTKMQGRVFFDLLNEPEQYGQMWENTQKVGLKTLYIAAMDAIDKQSDKAIYFLEGTGHSSLKANWGDGYAVDDDRIRTLRLSDIRPFLSDLAQKPYRNRVVLAPHVYGPAVTYAQAAFSGAGLFDRLSTSFGHFTANPFEIAGQKLVFPVAIGEFGSHFTDAGDKTFMSDFARYLKNEGDAKDGHHNAIGSWFYWCWNCNSGDTGGLVKEDWTTLQWEKIKYLRGLGLTPWHKVAPVSAPVTAPVSAPAVPAPAPAPTQKPAPAAAAPIPTPAAKASPSAAAPVAAHPVPNDGKIHAQVGYNGKWQSGGKAYYVYNLHITNTTDKPINVPFDIEVVGPKFDSLGETWNLSNAKIVDGRMVAKVTAEWASLPPSGHGTTNVGFIGASTEDGGKLGDGNLHGIKVAGQELVVDEG